MTQRIGNLHPQDTPGDVINPNIVNENIPDRSISAQKLTYGAMDKYTFPYWQTDTSISIDTTAKTVTVPANTYIQCIGSTGAGVFKVSDETTIDYSNHSNALWVLYINIADMTIFINDYNVPPDDVVNSVPVFAFSEDMGGRVVCYGNTPVDRIVLDGIDSKNSLCVLSDSYGSFSGHTTGKAYYPNNDVTTWGDMWQPRVVNRLSISTLRNYSYSGSLVSRYETSTADVSFCARVSDLPQSDIIVVMGGTNDVLRGAPIGTPKYSGWTDDDLERFAPAFAYVINESIGRSKQVVVVIPPLVVNEYAEAIVAVCEHYSIPYVSAVCELHSQHPTNFGMFQICEAVCAAVRNACVR